jgi:hypothetical protein
MCSDDHEDGIDWVEAKTEAWAEVIYAIVIAQGKRQSAQTALYRQLDWMRAQNYVIRRDHMKTESMEEFPWRYTIGKEIVFRKITGIEEGPRDVHGPRWTGSLRLTPPPTAEQKRVHGVANRSTML